MINSSILFGNLPVRLCFLLGAACSLISPLRAVSFRLPNQDPEAIARGNAFAATADNPSAIYYNPAGITQLKGQNASIGLYLVSAGTEFESATGAKAKTDTSFQPVPQLYYVFTPKDSPVSFGFGVYAPYGLSLDWGDSPPFRTSAQKGKVLYASANPVVAWQIHPSLSIGIGPTLNYSEAEFKRGISPLNPADQFRFKGDGVDFGFNAGLMWKPHEQWALGVNYRYLTTVNYEGHSEASPYFPRTTTSASLRFPQYVVAGISFRATENWNLEVDIDWTDWDNVNQSVFRGTSFGDVPLVFNYRSSFMYEFGVTRKLDHGYFVSAGYFYSENSSPDANFNPLVPDSNLHLGSIGFGHKGSRWDWALAYHFGYNGGGGRVVTGSTPDVNGTYRTLNHAFNLSAGLKF